MTPLYQHDCSRCRFLGTLYNEVDFYECNNDTSITVIARYSSMCSDYASATGTSREINRLRQQQLGSNPDMVLVIFLFKQLPSILLSGMAWA